MKDSFRAALAQFPVGRAVSPESFFRHIETTAGEAAENGADLIVFPEYSPMELTLFLPPDQRGTAGAELAGLQKYLPRYLDTHRTLARNLGLTLLAGSFPQLTPEGFRNRAWIFLPDGKEDFQEKLVMTPFEQKMCVDRGKRAKVFQTPVGTLGVAVCYDSEFPLIVRRMCLMGAETILVPACTDTRAGFERVTAACRARALENQCYVLQTHTVGTIEGCAALDVNTGGGAAYAPPDEGFPDDGILVRGEIDLPGLLYADLDLALIRNVRKNGQVRNYSDWGFSEGV